MIVKRDSGGWTLIEQMEHAQQCGGIARAWRDGPSGPDSVSSSLEYAAGYHDLGWIESDAAPEIDEEGRPRNFTKFDEQRHCDFYQGAVRTIAGTDPFAAYLVSLHASGLYSRRYAWAGLQPVDWTAIGPRGKALLTGERAYRAELLAAIPDADAEFENAWRSYMLLEVFDYLSLLTCFSFDSDGCAPVPGAEGTWDNLKVRRLGTWEVELDPFPFSGRKLEIEVDARHLAQERFESTEELRAAFAEAEPEPRVTVYSAAS